MVAKPIETTQRTFAKKGDATSFYREILNRYNIGDRISDEDAEDLYALLEFHPEKIEKVGPGISHFEIMDGGFNTQCFCIARTDGTRIDFSYKHCIASA